MRLWQKIFFCSLALIIIVIDVVSIIIIFNDHRMNIELEEKRAVSQHEFVSASITNNVFYKRIQSKQLLLDENSVNEVLTSLKQDNVGTDTRFSVFDKKNMLCEYNLSNIDQTFKSRVINENKNLTVINKNKRETEILVGSSFILEGRDYYLFTSYDLTAVYNNLTEQLKFVQIMSLICAMVVAVILIVIVLSLLKPLHRVNRTIKSIADGNYELRVAGKGGQEFRELSKNVNNMVDAIVDNIEQIQSVSDGRKQFIDNLAHEMKTPLTSILGFADILRVKRTIDDKKRQEYSKIIVTETKRLQTLSGKILQLATTSEVSMDVKSITVVHLFKEVMVITAPLFAKNDIKLLCKGKDAMILIDKELFKSLIYNLLDNAIKASSPGQEIWLVCHKTDENILISVIDHGIGMKESELKKITEPFYMVDKSRSRKAGGAGLGLALCIEIAKLHDAVLEFESALGHGTKVTIRMPEERSISIK